MSRSPARLDREIADYLASPGSDPLAATLLPPGKNPAIGPERCTRRGDIRVCRSPHGSVRYLHAGGGRIVAGLQVVSADGRLATIANAYTVPSHRRRGLAARLLAAARRDFDVVRHADDEHLSEDGRKFREATR